MSFRSWLQSLRVHLGPASGAAPITGVGPRRIDQISKSWKTASRSASSPAASIPCRRVQPPPGGGDRRLQQRRQARPSQRQPGRNRERAAGQRRRHLPDSPDLRHRRQLRGSLAVADFNNDGNLDLVTVNTYDNTVSVLLGNGDGNFRPPINAPILPGASEVAAADFNRDGNMDLIYTSSGLNGGWGSVEVLLGDGRGGFGARHQYQIHTQNPTGLAVADLNADGRPDVVTANLEFTVSVLLGTGDGTLSYDFASSIFSTGSYAGDVAVGDFNSDGIPDLVATGGSSSNNFLAGHGDGTFAAPILSPALDGMWLAAADFNGDGRFDVLTVVDSMDFGGVGTLSLDAGGAGPSTGWSPLCSPWTPRRSRSGTSTAMAARTWRSQAAITSRARSRY